MGLHPPGPHVLSVGPIEHVSVGPPVIWRVRNHRDSSGAACVQILSVLPAPDLPMTLPKLHAFIFGAAFSLWALVALITYLWS
jgi:hypothetical protein